MRETILIAQPLEPMLDVDTLARACRVDTYTVEVWVNEGILEAAGVEAEGLEPSQWRFASEMLTRALQVARLQRELDLDPAAAAICAALLDEIERLRAQVRSLQFQLRQSE